MREQGRGDYSFAGKLFDLVQSFFIFHFKKKANECSVYWEAFISHSVNLLLEFSLNVLESKNLGVFDGQILIRVPIAVLE